MEQFFVDYWPHILAVITTASAVAKLIITRFPQTAKYLKYVAAVVDIIIYAGKVVKNAKAKDSQPDPSRKG
jgi:hypothetical protein